jgi:hypothetical protein
VVTEAQPIRFQRVAFEGAKIFFRGGETISIRLRIARGSTGTDGQDARQREHIVQPHFKAVAPLQHMRQNIGNEVWAAKT